MSSQERIKSVRGERGERAERGGRLRASESMASSVASGLQRAPAPGAGAADLGRVLLTDDYFSDVNPRSMRRLMNVLYVTGTGRGSVPLATYFLNAPKSFRS